MHPNDEVWTRLARRCPWATFFHTPLWRDLALAAYPQLSDRTLCAELPGGSMAVYPLVGNGNLTSSSFAGCYGGPIAEAELGPRRLRALHAAAARAAEGELEVLTGPLLDTATAVPPRFGAGRDATHLLPLEPGYEVLRQGFARGHRSSIRKAAKAGVEVERVTAEHDYRAYYEIYEDSLVRWGDNASSNYPWEVLGSAHQVAQRHPENVQLWLARCRGETAAGALMFYWNRHAVYWHGAANRVHFEARPVNALFAEIIRDACERGFAVLDFNPSGGHAGTVEFKRRFGSIEQPLWRLTYTPLRQVLAARLRSPLTALTR